MFSHLGFSIQTLTGQLIHRIQPRPFQPFFLYAKSTKGSTLWHNRLGHPSNYVFSHISIPSLSCSTFDKFRNACNTSKSTRLPFSPTLSWSTTPLHIIHYDIWGPSPRISRSNYRYFIIFIDDYSRFTWMYPLAFRLDAPGTFRHFKSLVENLFSLKIKKIFNVMEHPS